MSAPAPAALELRGVEVAVGGRPILSGVSLRVQAGEFIAVLGPNGAGKSTLMKAILGLIPTAAGDVRVLGRRPEQGRAHTGYLPQRHGFDAGTRIRGVDLVMLGLTGTRLGLPLGLTAGARRRRHAERERVAEVIARVGAEGYAQRPIGELSGGEQQRLLIAAALVDHPRLLLLDEPLDGLDLPNQAAVAGLVRSLCAQDGVSVLLVAHDVNPLAPYLDRVVYLAGGQAMAGPVEEVITGPHLSALYGVPIEVLRTSDGRLVVVGQPDAPHHHRHHDDEPHPAA